MTLVKNYEVTDSGMIRCTKCGNEEYWERYIWDRCAKCGARSWYVIDDQGNELE